MEPADWKMIKEVFHEALRLDGSERDSYLDRECGSGSVMRLEVESLLTSLSAAQTFLEQPVLGETSIPNNGWRLENGHQISHYKVISPIATGGMGEVYLAEDLVLRRKVALKIMPESLFEDAERLRRFRREADAISALNHPNILTIFEFGTEGDIQMLAFEFVEGDTLRDRLRSGPLPTEDAIEIGLQIVSALKAAHAAGVIHRDIKPENIMIRNDGYVKVLDFGLAKLTGPFHAAADRLSHQSISNPGMIMGTVSYMSPEQARAKGIDSRTDIFSFGVVLFEMLTGKTPFDGVSTTDVIARILQDDPPSIREYNSSAPGDLESVVSKCLEKEADDRFQSTGELESSLKLIQRRFQNTSDQVTAIQEKPLTAGSETAMDSVVSGRSRSRLFLIGSACVVLAATVIFAGFWYGGEWLGASQIERIAVMPFANESGNPDLEYLSDGMTDSLINSLSNLPSLSVKARNSVFRYKGLSIEEKKIGQDLDVQAVVLGRVVQRGENITLYLSLVDTRTGTSLLGEQYDRKMQDLAVLQKDITRDISQKLRFRLSNDGAKDLTKNYSENSEAYELYLRGRYFWSRRTSGSIPRAIEYFKLAIEKDPSFGLAYSGLADAYVVPSNRMAPHDAMPKAKAAAIRALEIDDSIAEAHTSLARVLQVYEWNWNEAEREFKKAIQLDPRYPVAHHWYGGYFERIGRVNESISERKLALDLDPLSAVINFELGQAFYFAGDYDRAIEQFQKALELDPDFATSLHFLIAAYGQKGMYDAALARIEATPDDGALPGIGYVGYVYAAAGRTKDARNMLDEFMRLRQHRYVSAANIAMIYLGLGKKDEALSWLEKAYDERAYHMQFLKVDRRWDPLRDDPRFADLVRRIGFPE